MLTELINAVEFVTDECTIIQTKSIHKAMLESYLKEFESSTMFEILDAFDELVGEEERSQKIECTNELLNIYMRMQD